MSFSFSYIASSLLKLITYPCNVCRFRKFHISSRFVKPMLLTPSCISVGRNVFVFNNARIEGIRKYKDTTFHPHIILEDGVTIQQNVHITCATQVLIKRNTSVSANVTITDINHPYADISLPIEQQDIETRPVQIGEDCKLYNNVVILPGVTIGKHCVIGANSVVTKDIPDYSVAVGAPARVVKLYNPTTKQWEKVNE